VNKLENYLMKLTGYKNKTEFLKETNGDTSHTTTNAYDLNRLGRFCERIKLKIFGGSK